MDYAINAAEKWTNKPIGNSPDERSETFGLQATNILKTAKSSVLKV